MKYFIRSVKYFIYLTVLITIILAILILIGAVESNIQTMFRNGYNALWQIAILFAAVAAAYPKVGYATRDIPATGDWYSQKAAIKDYMLRSGRYRLEKEEGETLTFRLTGVLNQLTRTFEDRITITQSFEGIRLEGMRKDVLRIASALERTLNPDNAQ